jgi:HEPN domain-containing protein
MVDSLRFNDWIEKAKKDIKSAKVLKENDCGNDVVAFHSQQAIEKALKGFLLINICELVGGHSLIYLCKEATRFNQDFKKHLKDCAFVNQYYIETRYPADSPLIVTEEEADECIEIAEKILNIVQKV